MFEWCGGGGGVGGGGGGGLGGGGGGEGWGRGEGGEGWARGEGGEGWDYLLRIYPRDQLKGIPEMPPHDHVEAGTRVVGYQEKQDDQKRKRIIRMVLEGDEAHKKTQKKKDDE